MIEQIIAALATIKEILGLVNTLRKFVEENKNEKWWQEFSVVRTNLVRAESPEERRKAISDYARSIAGL